jgi:hypothetical protein
MYILPFRLKYFIRASAQYDYKAIHVLKCKHFDFQFLSFQNFTSFEVVYPELLMLSICLNTISGYLKNGMIIVWRK